MYGSFGVYRAGTLPGEPIDPNLYLFSTSSNGIKVARVGLLAKTKRHYVSRSRIYSYEVQLTLRSTGTGMGLNGQQPSLRSLTRPPILFHGITS